MNRTPEEGSQNMLYEAEARQIAITAVGDSTIYSHLSPHREERFLSLLKIIRDADVAYAHEEGSIATDEGYPAHDTGNYQKQPPWAADELKWLGFDIVSCASNHTMDYAVGGLLATIENLDRVGLVHAGIGRDLAEARTPVYFDSAKGRIGLISMCSFFSPWARAGEPGLDCPGRPGLNPLRYETRYVVDARALQELKRISDMMGLETQKEKRAKFGTYWGEVPDSDTEFNFLNTDFVGKYYNKFVLGDKPGIDTVANGRDAEENIRWIKDARKQADWVLVDIHSHEADGERERPARFFPPFAKACIDAGADAVIGSGPHWLRGIEIYKGKPILYSLGNFIYQVDVRRRLPPEFYERYELDPKLTLQEVLDVLTKNGTTGNAADPAYWEAVCAALTFKGDKLDELRLYPLTLGFGKNRAQHGRPLLADGKLGRDIIQRVSKLSEPYGTKIDFRDGIGFVKL